MKRIYSILKITAASVCAVFYFFVFNSQIVVAADGQQIIMAPEAGSSDQVSWSYVSISDDGTKMAAAGSGDYIYTSTDSGVTWSTNSDSSGTRNWNSITSSADGTKLAATVSSGYIYTSADSGATWTQQTGSGSRSWRSITSSADGVILAATVNSGSVYVSSDSGVTWTTNTNSSGTRAWRSITSSADGTKLAAIVNNNYIYTSSDSGVTWTTNSNSSGSRTWSSITSSNDGTKLAATVTNGSLYLSNDSGVTWTAVSSLGTKRWSSVSNSNDGTTIVATVNGGQIYYSTDSGSTWKTTGGNMIQSSWNAVALNSDGTKLVAVAEFNFIHTGAYALGPSISITSPTQDQDVLAFSPVVNWDVATTCEYAYDYPMDYITVDCANNGSDIPAQGNGETFLYIKGTDLSGVHYDQISFNYSPLEIGSPQDLSTIYGWTPSVQWPNAAIACSYSYNGTTYQGVNCQNDGSDIPVPSSYGPVTLYVKAVDSLSNQVVVTSSFTYSAPTWQEHTSAGARGWGDIESSADGTKLAAVAFNTYVYLSNDSGVTWTAATTSGSRLWDSVTMSADGTKLAAAAAGGSIYTSSNSGATWTTNSNSSGSRSWSDITSSDDGTKIAAIVDGGYIYTSTDSGVTWTARTVAGLRDWSAISSSADGTRLVAGENGGYISTSDDSGVTWLEHQDVSFSTVNISSISMSDDGARIVATDYVYDGVYVSSDYGSNWVQLIGFEDGPSWNSVTSSGDGMIVAIAGPDSGDGQISISRNGGTTWAREYAAGSRNWNAITVSSDGTKFAAAVKLSGYIYTYPPVIVPSSGGVSTTYSYDYENGILTTTTGGRTSTSSIDKIQKFSFTAPTANGTSSNEPEPIATSTPVMPVVATSTIDVIPATSTCKPGDVFNTMTGARCSGSVTTNTPANNSASFVFTKDLKLGMTDIEVFKLQQYLNSHGFIVSISGAGSVGNESNYFGIKTQLALIKYQITNYIHPAVGYFGPVTRNLINS